MCEEAEAGASQKLVWSFTGRVALCFAVNISCWGELRRRVDMLF